MHTSFTRTRLRSWFLGFTVALLGASFVAMPNAAEAAKSQASTKKRAKQPSKAELKRIAAQRAARAAALARARQEAKEAALHSQRASLHAGAQPVVDESLQLISNIVLLAIVLAAALAWRRIRG